MKQSSLIIFLIFFFIFSNYSNAQTRKIETPGGKIRITNFKRTFLFSKVYEYDVDFKIRSNVDYLENKVLIEINEKGTGRIVELYPGGEKMYFKILSCYERKYANSSDLYWEINVSIENIKIVGDNTMFYYLDRERDLFWFDVEPGTRSYLSN